MNARGLRAGMAAVLAIAAGVGLTGGGAQPSGRSLNIRVDWVTPPPERVAFDGGSAFDQKPGYFVKPVAIGGSAAVHDLAVAYPRFQIPLRLIASPQRGSDIEFTVTAPADAACERPAVNEVARSAPSGTVEERVALLIRARRLIGLCGGFELELPKLVRKYYEVSCSLAGDRNSFFAIHADATERFSKLARTPYTVKALTDCRGRGVGPELRKTWRAAQAARARGDSAAVAALTDDLLAKTSDEDWEDGFEAESLTPTLIRELKVIDLKSRQNDAALENDFDRAIELNDTLQTLQGESPYAGVFENVGVNEALLSRERADFEIRRAAAAEQ